MGKSFAANYSIEDVLFMLEEGEKLLKNSVNKKSGKNKQERFQQKDDKGYVVFLDGFWSKGRAHELIDAKGVGHYYEGNTTHGCNGSCAREDFRMAAELDKIDNDVVKYIKEYGMDSVFEEVKIKYVER